MKAKRDKFSVGFVQEVACGGGSAWTVAHLNDCRAVEDRDTTGCVTVAHYVAHTRAARQMEAGSIDG